MDRRKKRIVLFGLLSLAMLAFIFIRSAQPSADSKEESNRILELLRTLFDPKGVFFTERWTTIIRKIAHFAEFAVLGALIGGFTLSLCELRGARYYALPLLLVLLAGVVDETIQTFVLGRSGSPRDVLLDFCGSIAGLVLAAVVIQLHRRRQTRKKTENNS